MTMLSRVADRLYWTARYLERIEDTARLTKAYTHLIMDLPKGSELGWDILVRIYDGEDAFGRRFRVYNEKNVLSFIIADSNNFSSIVYSINAARENVRTTRDVLPKETWELVNELYIYAQELAEKSIGRRNRHEFLDQIINRCQMINGLLLTSLSRNHAYRFLKLGHMIERADMTTRIIDVGADAILSKQGDGSTVIPLLCASLLHALSAVSAYRRILGPITDLNSVVNFVIKEASMPRSIQFCIAELREELLPLKNHNSSLYRTNALLEQLEQFNVENMSLGELHTFIDKFQGDLNDLSNTISKTWFMTVSE